jgi:NAD(P)-dependent dehydrogenase (short-subunit alcohol dehydrogenase family)
MSDQSDNFSFKKPVSKRYFRIAGPQTGKNHPSTPIASATRRRICASCPAVTRDLVPVTRALDVVATRCATAQHPAGRAGTVEDIAALAAFLLGPDSAFITGAEFIIDGGMTRKMIYAE